MPILLEDLYPPPARSVYRRVRAWEQNLTAALEDDHLGALDVELRRTLHRHTLQTGIALRRHLLLVQRLRFVIASAPETTERHPLYDLWVDHRIGWSGGIAEALDKLERASEPFVGWDGTATIPRVACDQLVQLAEHVALQARTRTARLREALRAHEESAHTPS